MYKSSVIASLWLLLLLDYANSKSDVKCASAPPKISHGRLVRGMAGRYAEYQCGPGYLIVGTPYSSCRDGLWSADPPLCLGRRCRRPEYLSHGTTILSYKGTLARFSCERGYVLKGPSVIGCDGSKWNDTQPICVEAKPEGKSLVKTTRSPTSWMADADYSCISERGGVMPPSVEGGTPTVKWAQVGGRPRLYVRYTCRYGYEAKGRSRVYCKEGQWVGTPPSCQAFDHEENETPAKDVQSQRDDSRPGARTHAQWVRLSDYSCAHTSATAPEVSDSHSWTRYAVIDGMPRLYAQYQCKQGYRMVGEAYLYCRKGHWDGNKGGKPQCLPKDSDASHDDPCQVRNGDCRQRCDNVGGRASCSCYHGYMLQRDGRTCEDINECLIHNGQCAQTCLNSDGSFRCECRHGYVLAKDGKHCSQYTYARGRSEKPPYVLFHRSA